MKVNAKEQVKKALCYVIGLFIITIGINISKMSQLGISPVSSIPRSCELIWGITLGKTTMIIYCILIILQAVILRKKFRLTNVLGIALTFAFGWMIDITGTDPNAFCHLLINFPRPHSYAVKLVYSISSVVIIGTGVFLYLRPHWVPMPAEGLAAAISETTGKAFGDCKSAVDTSMIAVALVLQLIFLGGLGSFSTPDVVVREGTVIASLGVGQVVKFLSRKLSGSFDAWFRA